MRLRALVNQPINISAEPAIVDRRRTAEHGHSRLRGHKAMPSQRQEFAHRHPVAGHDKRLATIKTAHDLPAVIPKFPLCDLPSHPDIVARVLRQHLRCIEQLSRSERVGGQVEVGLMALEKAHAGWITVAPEPPRGTYDFRTRNVAEKVSVDVVGSYVLEDLTRRGDQCPRIACPACPREGHRTL